MSAYKPMPILCATCGESESQHHKFVPQMPDGCKCSPGDWWQTANTICAAFVVRPKSDRIEGEGPDDNCATCEHERACHR